MKTMVLAAVALAFGAVASDAATLCARKHKRPVPRAACRAGESRVDATVCARKSGQLVLRGACRAGERPFDRSALAAIGGGGSIGAPGPAGDPGRFPVQIVDANQQDVGEIAHFQPIGSSVRIQRGPLTEPVLFDVDAGGFTRIVSPLRGTFYVSADCAGVPYMEDDASGLVRAEVYGTAAYYSRAPQVAELQYQSYESDLGDAPCPMGTTATPRRTCCTNSSAKVTFVQSAVRVDLASLGLVPPFRAVPR
jgi:hypothetical protein